MADAYAFRQEWLSPELEHEMLSLVRDYYAVTPAHDGIPEYDFVWENFRALGDALVITTARTVSDKALSGYMLYIITDHPHHRGLRIAFCDTFCTGHQHRGKGVGKALYQCTEPLLIERGVKRICNGYRHVYGARPIFDGLGFKAEETMYIKRID